MIAGAETKIGFWGSISNAISSFDFCVPGAVVEVKLREFLQVSTPPSENCYFATVR